MIVRLVKMIFKPDKMNDFDKIFDGSKEKIRSFDGCLFLELLRSEKEPNVYFTYSKWESEEKLENYRSSELFILTWSDTKMLFQEKPEAYSLNSLFLAE
ncbi:MAG TPA: antibiotic biosynthesis monooxygenase [Flavobacteriales bacterium]|nr:antibiotic biosynthesis monooxygenase [Flavobacteriales bacterium]